jgi:uncharacterized protein YxjI
MGMFGDRRTEGSHRYLMREKLLAVGDDFWIEDESGAKVYKVDGKAMRLRQTFVLEDRSGHELARIQERKMTVRDTMVIERAGRTATVRKRLLGIRDHYKVEVDGGPTYSAHGGITDHNYDIEKDGAKVAAVSKKWFRARDSYGVEVEPDQDDVLILAITVCVDAMARGGGHWSPPASSPLSHRSA